MCDGILGSLEPNRVMEARMTKWPNYGLDEDGSYQYNEGEA